MKQMRILLSVSVILATFAASFFGIPHPQGCLANVGSESFPIGGHIPNWLITYDAAVNAPLTPEQSEILPAYQHAMQQKADEWFAVVIPGAITWNTSEPRQGKTDFRLYDPPAAWAKQHHKNTIVQHLFWEDPSTIPAWAKALRPNDLKKALANRIRYTKEHIEDVYGLTVLNEMLYYHYLRNRLGDGMVKDLFDAAKKAFPHTVLYLDENPWQHDIDPHDPNPVMTGMTRLVNLVNTLKSQKVSFDKVGIQLYTSKEDVEKIGGIDSTVRQLKNSFDYFKQSTGYNLTILEFGFTSSDETYQAQFIKKMLTMCKENSVVEGFFFFHWLNEQVHDNALVLKNGSPTPAGRVVSDFKKTE